ncbi:MAG: hypothetical protein KatS3mg002_0038 [Candidatus Woesearchaeota archaeon]|nr:MAG: hypothetical protein KatS3mg002_0038 [Candidatus Woesearchaeota archaeon]
MEQRKNKKIFIISVFLLTLFFIIILSPIFAYRNESNVQKKYLSIEDKINSEGKAEVIVRIIPEKKQKNEMYSLSVAENSMKNPKRLNIINAYSGELTRRGLKELKALERQGYKVEIYDNIKFKLYATKEEKKLRTALDTTVVSIGANYSHNVLNITGRNITVAVIDSGIDYNHTDLGGCFGINCRVKGGYDFVNNDSDPIDDYGHGTHVAGIIGAKGNLTGVAPDVEFLAIKSCDVTGTCDLDDVISGVEWAVNNSADIISMSLGGSFSDVVYGNTGKDSTSLAIEAAVNSGKIVVIAAGNEGPGISTIAVPGASENVITVGASDDNGTIEQSDDFIWSGSGRGPSAFGRLDPEIVAPGVTIYSTYLNNTYTTMTGTSMATPHVTGVIALLLEQRQLDPSKARRIIMNSAFKMPGKLFERGTGEINAINALTYNLTAIVYGVNSYNNITTNDRWEFITPINGTVSANITIINYNTYDINISLLLTDFENMENSYKLNTSQFSIPSNILVNASSNQTFTINFTTINFTSLYATTYGGELLLLSNDSKNISIPIVVTVPIKNYANIIRTITHEGENKGDVLYYAYYNPKPGNKTIRISWNSSVNDLDLYVYNDTAEIYDYGGYYSTNNESLTIAYNKNISWFRIHAYNITTLPFNFTINITYDDNIPPNITNVTNQNGEYNFNFSLSQNVTIIFFYENPDNDSLTIELNDSRYTLESLYTNNVTYKLVTNESMLGNHTVRLTITDEYGASVSRDVQVEIYDIRIREYYPSNLTIIVRKNDTINFSQISEDSNNRTLYYYWYINGELNSTDENITINTTQLSQDNYNITFIVSNNFTNTSIMWNLTIDQYGPVISIIYPNGTINDTFVNISYTVTDISGIGSCWYNINSTSQNTTLTNCTNTTITLTNGNYTITIYSNDTYGFINSSSKVFQVNDITPPQILSVSPSGTISYTNEVTLRVSLNEYSICRYSDEDIEYNEMSDTFSNKGLNNTESYPVEGGKRYEIYVKCRDLAYNINPSTTIINFSVRQQSTSSGSSGGGGGGSFGGVSPSQNTIQNINKYGVLIASANNNITINVSNNNIVLRYMFIKLSQNKRNVDISITQHDINSAPLPINSFDKNKEKYAFIEISHLNIDNTDIEENILRFKVSRSWIDDNSIDVNSVKLYRYVDDWTELPTKIYSQDQTGIIFEAISPGLSYFIIAGNKEQYQNQEQMPPTIVPPMNEVTGDSVLIKKDVEQEKPLSLTDQESGQQDNTAGILRYIIYVIAIAFLTSIVASSVYVVNKKKSEKAAMREEQINMLKKRYEFEGNQIIQEYNTRLRIIGRDPNARIKAEQLRQLYNQRIQELHLRYKNLIDQIRNSK